MGSWLTILQGAGALGSVTSATIAVWLVRVARDFRQIDWHRQQNDAWNKFNEKKFGNATHFEAAEKAIFENGDINSLSFEGRAAVHLRMNIMERDVRGIVSGLIYDGDYEFVIKEFLRMGPNRRAIIRFLEEESYDSRYVQMVDVILALGEQGARYDDPRIRAALSKCARSYRTAMRVSRNPDVRRFLRP